MPVQQFCIQSALSLTTIKTVVVLCSWFHDSLYKETQGVKLTGSCRGCSYKWFVAVSRTPWHLPLFSKNGWQGNDLSLISSYTIMGYPLHMIIANITTTLIGKFESRAWCNAQQERLPLHRLNTAFPFIITPPTKVTLPWSTQLTQSVEHVFQGSHLVSQPLLWGILLLCLLEDWWQLALQHPSLPLQGWVGLTATYQSQTLLCATVALSIPDRY